MKTFQAFLEAEASPGYHKAMLQFHLMKAQDEQILAHQQKRRKRYADIGPPAETSETVRFGRPWLREEPGARRKVQRSCGEGRPSCTRVLEDDWQETVRSADKEEGEMKYSKQIGQHLAGVITELTYYDQWKGKPAEAPDSVPKDRVMGSKESLTKRLTHFQGYAASKMKELKDLQDKDREISAKFAKTPGALKKHKAAFQRDSAALQSDIKTVKASMDDTRFQLGVMQNHEHGGIKQDSGNVRRVTGAREKSMHGGTYRAVKEAESEPSKRPIDMHTDGCAVWDKKKCDCPLRFQPDREGRSRFNDRHGYEQGKQNRGGVKEAEWAGQVRQPPKKLVKPKPIQPRDKNFDVFETEDPKGEYTNARVSSGKCNRCGAKASWVHTRSYMGKSEHELSCDAHKPVTEAADAWRDATPQDVTKGNLKMIGGKAYRAVFMPVKDGPGEDDYVTKARWHRASSKEISRHGRIGSVNKAPTS